jgi:renalase
VITAHGSPAYSKARYDWSDEAVLADMSERLAQFVQGEVVEAQLKRWRYAQPVILHEEPTLLAEGLLPLALAGDGFCIPRVEGAALSGLAAGRAIKEVISRQ